MAKDKSYTGQDGRKQALRLAKTARGQIDSAIAMLEEGRYCVDICKQLLAVPALLKKANLLVLHNHIGSCVREAINKGEGQEKVEEIFELISRYSKE